MFDLVVVGGGPAGMQAAGQAARLGAKTALVTKNYVGGMAAVDGPVPVRALAYAARLVREAQQLERYGISSTPPLVDLAKLLDRVQEVVREVHDKLAIRRQLDSLGVTVHELAGVARFTDPHTVETDTGLRLAGQKIIICTGGSRGDCPFQASNTRQHTVTFGV
jgi:pyruvate/2-oxoglutarate dehydrogenase complex dihydrolipoamide dehydrogenase (E3) component